MTLIIINPGLLSTVQDIGRAGYRSIGVTAGGAMDDYALQAANMLVGNARHAAAIEMTLAGAVIEAASDVLIAVTGADMAPEADGAPIPLWRPVLVRRGTTIAFGRAAQGCRAYVAAAGGIDVPPVLGGRGTDVRAGFGGAHGRPLAAGDALHTGAASMWAAGWAAHLAAESAARGRPIAAPEWYALPDGYAGGAQEEAAGIVLRTMPAADGEAFTAEARERFYRETYRVSPALDRMGVRLEGPPLAHARSAEMTSRGIMPGAVQVPSGGAPIVLGADCQTTGGYPVIAHVAAADLPLLGQVRPGDRIRFAPITLGDAHRLIIEREASLRLLAAGLSCRRAR